MQKKIISNLSISLKDSGILAHQTVAKLEKSNFHTLKDVLLHIPYAYQDLSTVTPISQIKQNSFAVVVGTISSVRMFRSPRYRLFMVNASLEDASGKLRVVWFNQPYLVKQFAGNPLVAVWGTAVKNNFGLNISNPSFQILSREDDDISNELFGIFPMYPNSEGTTGTYIKTVVQKILHSCDLSPLADPLPKNIREQLRFPTFSEALILAHSPKTLEEARTARKRFAFEKLFFMQLKLYLNKATLAQQKAPIISIHKEEISRFLKRFDFSLTQGQTEVVADIFRSFEKPFPQNRLIQGEVGSGKTLVAEIAALTTILSGYQVCMMAPTEILARQHFQRATKDFAQHDIGIGLLVSKETQFAKNGFTAKKKKEELHRLLLQKRIQLLIGTHALLEIKHPLSDVGLIIIDEQQRFGVKQRGKLFVLSSEKQIPHVLSMTATPIPRTLALALYADMQLSLLKDMPGGRKPVQTKIIKETDRPKLYAFAMQELKKGHQFFVICPRVEVMSDENKKIQSLLKMEIKNVKEEFEKIKKAFPTYKTAMLYGSMKSDEKADALDQLQNGRSQILVASSVIEVGIDLPLATVMLIEGAERFGLSQLHQMRGRVGRSIHQSSCFLIPQKYSATAYRRLKAMEESNDAMYLAEKDLEIRGAGELLGQRQSGLSDLTMEALQNTQLVAHAKHYAEDIIQEDPFLKNNPLLKEEVNDLHISYD